ncbi:MAG: hypothetical protein QOF76_3075 [Solirubrobacteraceae bacterium]|jgi:hypothetical protein|nr:hypothetical protein [Solirubrobacteraceae bacterium]
MQFGTAIFLIAVGAILKYAVNVTTEGFNVNTAGVILMVVGAIGLVVAVLFTLVRPRDRAVVVERDRDLYR